MIQNERSLLRIEIPVKSGEVFSYQKMMKSPGIDLVALSVCVKIAKEHGVVRQARVSVFDGVRSAYRSDILEKFIEDKRADCLKVGSLENVLSGELVAWKDEYKAKVFRILFKRALEELLKEKIMAVFSINGKNI